MKRFLKLKQLSQRGIVHHLAPILVVVLLGGITTGFIYVHGKAATPWSGALSVGPNGSHFCLNASSMTQGATIKLDNCKSVVNQKWLLFSAGTVSGGGKTVRAYNIETFAVGKSLCVDDWQTSTKQGKNNPLKLYKCSPSDDAQRWIWAGDGHQLKNVAASTKSGVSQCMDNQGGVLKSGNPIDLYKCKAAAATNQDWFEIANSVSSTSTPAPAPSPSPNPPSSGGVNTSPAVQNWSGALQLGLDKTLCLAELPGNDTVVYPSAAIEKCNHSQSQKWQRVPVDSRTFLMKSVVNGACIDDPGSAVGVSGHRVNVRLTTCDKSNRDQVLIWANAGTTSTNTSNSHELMFGFSTGCVNDPANSKTGGTRQIVYSCAANSSNEQWFEAVL